MEMRVQRVDQLSKNVARNSAIPFRSGFDPYEWEDWKSPPSTSPGDPAQLKHENKQLQQQHEKAATEAGLPPNVATERRIANCDFHIFDLLRLAGRGSVIKDKDFMNCTIRGPGVIATFVPPWPPEKERENTPISSSFDKHTLYVEGDPDSVLYDVTSDSAFGVIHLVGCTYCRVTFKDIGIAGSPKHLKWWRENVKFSGPRTIGILRSEARIETTPQPGELEARCSHLADELDEEDRIYKSGIESVQLWRQELAEQGLPESEIDEKVARAEDENTIGALNRYNKHLKDRLLGLYDVLGSQGWFGGVDRSRFENPGDPYYMRNLAKRLREVCSKLPDS